MSDYRGTLIATDVDLVLLEQQRIKLGELTFNSEALRHMTEGQKSALFGVVNMLDAWSDDRLPTTKQEDI